MIFRAFCALLIVATTFLVAAPDEGVDARLRAVIERHGLRGDPTVGRVLPHISDPLAQLGKQLFHTRALGANGDSACVSCHHPLLGGGDGLVLPVGVDSENANLLGEGRKHRSLARSYHDGGPTVERNAQTIFNVGLWDRALFWDGRVESISHEHGRNGAGGRIMTPDSLRKADPFAGSNLPATQALFPIVSRMEMMGFAFGQWQYTKPYVG